MQNIFLFTLSILAALLYMRIATPELAIAEAVIGSGLVTFLYLYGSNASPVLIDAIAPNP